MSTFLWQASSCLTFILRSQLDYSSGNYTKMANQVIGKTNIQGLREEKWWSMSQKVGLKNYGYSGDTHQHISSFIALWLSYYKCLLIMYLPLFWGRGIKKWSRQIWGGNCSAASQCAPMWSPQKNSLSKDAHTTNYIQGFYFVTQQSQTSPSSNHYHYVNSS